MIIEIDAGNTRLKWRSRAAGGAATAAAVVDSVHELAAALAGSPADDAAQVAAIRIASVRAPESLAQLAAQCLQVFGVQPDIARVVSRCAGVSIQYSDPSRLGVDRWLALLAARARVNGPCLVVDSGTALTVDRLEADGAHGGGFIIPGLALMRRSLEENTRIRLSAGYEAGSVTLGHSTDAAVFHGSLAAAVALVRDALDSLREVSSDARLLLTGGGAIELLPHLGEEGAELVPDLVLDGLVLLYPGQTRSTSASANAQPPESGTRP